MKTRLWLAATLVLTLAFVGQVLAYRSMSPSPTVHASWAFHPKSLREARERAQSIVLAEVVSVAAGPDIVSKVPAEPNGEARLPTQRITVSVLKSYKGSATAGQQLTLFQTGGTRQNTAPMIVNGKELPSNVQQVILEGDPQYQVGEQYLLLLEGGPDNTLRPVSPEGRYRVENGTNLTPMVQGEVAREIHGKGLNNLEQALTAK